MRNILCLFTLLTLLAFSCSPKKEIAKNKHSKCTQRATVKDFTGTDGCSFLIVLPNGDRLLPTKLPEGGFEFKDGQEILFGFHPLKDVVSICMAEKLAIEVTCIQEVASDAIPVKKKCWDTENPNAVKWMQALVKKHKPTKIVKYEYIGAHAYWFVADDQKGYLYDCQGGLVCGELEKLSDCQSGVENPFDGQVIFQRLDR